MEDEELGGGKSRGTAKELECWRLMRRCSIDSPKLTIFAWFCLHNLYVKPFLGETKRTHKIRPPEYSYTTCNVHHGWSPPTDRVVNQWIHRCLVAQSASREGRKGSVPAQRKDCTGQPLEVNPTVDSDASVSWLGRCSQGAA